ncbi:hypothetical protein HMPREF0972_00364 [Actinomyces sp. oral taxon 848 str. F0332]|nr:hypothetical protein HMPREF0972_00364 [Actinomyces sp. oral taxon 848 str. F0332]
MSNAILTRFNPAAPEALAIDGARRRMRPGGESRFRRAFLVLGKRTPL